MVNFLSFAPKKKHHFFPEEMEHGADFISEIAYHIQRRPL